MVINSICKSWNPEPSRLLTKPRKGETEREMEGRRHPTAIFNLAPTGVPKTLPQKELLRRSGQRASSATSDSGLPLSRARQRRSNRSGPAGPPAGPDPRTSQPRPHQFKPRRRGQRAASLATPPARLRPAQVRKLPP